MNFDVDKVEPVQIIEQVDINALAFNNSDPSDEMLELNYSVDKIEIVSLTEQIDLEALAYANTDPSAEALELNFDVDKVEPVQIIKQISMEDMIFVNIEPDEDNLELRFYIDIESPVLDLLEEPVLNVELIASGEIEKLPEIKQIDKIQKQPVLDFTAFNNTISYLRESISIANEIETTRSDWEILDLALSQPDMLTYEELLFAAGIVNDPKEKLYIYNAAFLNIDRDWRAYNNAAVTAMQINQLELAECYLHQASMITEDLGKIENNFGVLACYKKDFDKAETHFNKAKKMGEDAQYNLLAVNLVKEEYFKISEKKTVDKDEDLYELMGDIIEYMPSDD